MSPMTVFLLISLVASISLALPVILLGVLVFPWLFERRGR